MRSLILFLIGSIVLGAGAIGIGYLASGTESLLQSGVAFGLTFAPAVLTLAWVVVSYRSDPNMMLLASLGGSGVRMAVALGGCFWLRQSYPDDFGQLIWWLALFYPLLLALEITLLVRQGPKPSETEAYRPSEPEA
jgi:hypothetical protein